MRLLDQCDDLMRGVLRAVWTKAATRDALHTHMETQHARRPFRDVRQTALYARTEMSLAKLIVMRWVTRQGEGFGCRFVLDPAIRDQIKREEAEQLQQQQQGAPPLPPAGGTCPPGLPEVSPSGAPPCAGTAAVIGTGQRADEECPGTSEGALPRRRGDGAEPHEPQTTGGAA